MWKWQSTKGGKSDHECGAKKPQLSPNELKDRPGQKKGHQAHNYKDETRAWWPSPREPITYNTGEMRWDTRE